LGPKGSLFDSYHAIRDNGSDIRAPHALAVMHTAEYSNGSPTHCWMTAFDAYPVKGTYDLNFQKKRVGLPGMLYTHTSSAVDLLG
jgi:hypothetical protein